MATTIDKVYEFLNELNYKCSKNDKTNFIEFGITDKYENMRSAVWMSLRSNGEVFIAEFCPRTVSDGSLIKVGDDEKVLGLIAKELLKINSTCNFGAWEIDSSGFLVFSVKTLLEENPLTIKQVERILNQGFNSLEDNEKILYMLEHGKPMPEKVNVAMTEEEKKEWEEFLRFKKSRDEDTSI